jgi:hypothetical protein
MRTVKEMLVLWVDVFAASDVTAADLAEYGF